MARRQSKDQQRGPRVTPKTKMENRERRRPLLERHQTGDPLYTRCWRKISELANG
jgi:hypothetical protein